MADNLDNYEIFKIGRMKVIFPTDVTEDELQFMAVLMLSYIHTAKYKSSNTWSIKDRLEEIKKEKTKTTEGVS